MARHLSFVFSTLLLAGALLPTASAITITEIAAPTGYDYVDPAGINNSGQVALTLETNSGLLRVGLYSGSSIAYITTSGSTDRVAHGINDAGVIVGNTQPASAAPAAFTISTSGTISTLSGDWFGFGINNSGVVTGANSSLRPFTRTGSTNTALPLLPHETGGYGTAINDSGVVGGSQNDGFIDRAFIFTPGVGSSFIFSDATDFGSEVWAINNAGVAVGQRTLSDASTVHAYLYSTITKIVTDIGSLDGDPFAVANGINAKGQVVGTSSSGDGSIQRAFLYSGGTMIDLNTVVAGTGWVLQSAADINDAGLIVGYGIDPSGKQAGFILNAAPEPGTMLLFGGGIALLAAARKFRR